MTKFLQRASVSRASALVLAAAIAVAIPQAAMAQKKSAEKGPTYKFSKPVQSLVAQAQQKQNAGDHAGALELLKQADALPEKNSDDVYIINMLTLNSAINLKDNALIEKSLEGALTSGRLTREDEVKFRRNLGAMAMQRNDLNKAVSEFEKLIAMDPSDAQLVVEVAELQRRRAQESELREGLRSVRGAIDAYKRAWDEGRIEKRIDDSGYPPTLDALVEGVPDIKDPKGARIYFLRRLPRDPFADPLLPAAQTWRLRSYASPPDAPAPGRDVFDVMSDSPGTALDGSAYRDW